MFSIPLFWEVIWTLVILFCWLICTGRIHNSNQRISQIWSQSAQLRELGIGLIASGTMAHRQFLLVQWKILFQKNGSHTLTCTCLLLLCPITTHYKQFQHLIVQDSKSQNHWGNLSYYDAEWQYRVEWDKGTFSRNVPLLHLQVAMFTVISRSATDWQDVNGTRYGWWMLLSLSWTWTLQGPFKPFDRICL